MRRLVMLGSGALVASVLVLMSIAVASADVTTVPERYRGAVEIKADGWIVFTKAQEEDYPLQGLTTFVKQGQRTPDGGCLFSGELVLPAGSEAIEVRQTAYNPQTCQARLERGTPPPHTLDGTTDSSEAFTQSTTASDESGLGDEAQASSIEPDDRATDSGFSTDAIRHSAGYHVSRYEDPVGLIVNRVRNNTDWRWNGNVVKEPVYNGFRLTWLTATGWERVAHDWNHRATTYQTTSSTFAHFRNLGFCSAVIGTPQPTTHTYYDRNRVHGRFNGDLVGGWNSWDAGGCRELLHFRHNLVRTLN